MHVHVGTVEFFQTACYLIIFGFLWRSLAARLADTPWGKAMGFIY